MIVLAAGMHRSGSTFAFNVARELLAARGTVYTESGSGVEPVLGKTGGARHLLFKTHLPDGTADALVRLGAARCLCTVRRPEDAVASYVETFGQSLESAIADVRAWLLWHRRMRGHVLTLPFELIDRRPWLAIQRLSRWLLGTVRPWESFRIWRRYRKAAVLAFSGQLSESAPGVRHLDFSYYDTATFFHRRHVTRLQSPSASERLGPKSVADIRSQLGDLLDSRGDYAF